MAKCPNSSRKRPGLGGGQAGCEGTVDLVVCVPVVLKCKRIPRGGDGFNQLAVSTVRKHGVRVQAESLKRLVNNYQYDCVCNLCGWSMGAAVRNAAKKEKKGAKKR